MYLVRFRLPSDLAIKLGVAEYRRTLETSDFATARARCLAATTWFRLTLEKLRGMPLPTREDFVREAAAFFDTLYRDRPSPLPLDPDGDTDLDIDIADPEAWELGRRRSVLKFGLAANLFGPEVREVAAKLAEAFGIELAQLPPNRLNGALRAVALAEIDCLSRRLIDHLPADDATNVETIAPPPAISGLQSIADVPVPSGSAASLAELGSLYVQKTRSRGVRATHITELERTLRWLGEVLGPNVELHTISKAQMRAFRDDLFRLDISVRGRRTPFKERLTNNAAKHIKFVTSERYWRSTKSFFSWCASEDYVPSDPTSGLKVEKPKGEVVDTPDPFTTDELIRLLRTPLFSG